MLKRITPDDTSGAMVRLGDVKTAAPFVSGLEYGAPARGVWNIVHIGMLIPGAHQIYVCAGNCLRGVVLTAAEMNAQSRFSTITIKENNVLDPGRYRGTQDRSESERTCRSRASHSPS